MSNLDPSNCCQSCGEAVSPDKMFDDFGCIRCATTELVDHPVTPMGLALMKAIGEFRFSYFDGGISDHGSGIWSECLTAEAAGMPGLPKTPRGVANVINGLIKSGLLTSTPYEGDESNWVDLTKLGVRFAKRLAE